MFKVPVRRKADLSFCTYRRGRRQLTCALVTIRTPPLPCDAMEELRRLVRQYAEPQDLRRAA